MRTKFIVILVLGLFLVFAACYRLLTAEKGSFSLYRHTNSLTGEVHELGYIEFEGQKSRKQ